MPPQIAVPPFNSFQQKDCAVLHVYFVPSPRSLYQSKSEDYCVLTCSKVIVGTSFFARKYPCRSRTEQAKGVVGGRGDFANKKARYDA